MTHPIISQINGLKDISSVTKVLEDNNIPFLSEGTTRTVYDLGDGTVLKLVIDPSFVSQNWSEIKIFKCSGREFFAEIYEHDKRNLWLVMEKLDTDKSKILSNLAEMFEPAIVVNGIERSIRSVENFVHYCVYRLTEVLQAAKTTEAADWARGFSAIVKTCKISEEDLHDNNVGIRPSTNTIVFLDYADYNLLSMEESVSPPPTLSSLIYGNH